ncbi:hypothetical protein [Pseudonocardia sp. NPDC049635]|uniref:hypothetical protein n=1 Tax=Pseudonocardia sp. NPDC049635 TaxID=3155506 RepID=UPI0034061E32
MASWYAIPGATLKGADGVGVSSASVDGNGNLTFTLTDATTLGPFPVKGDPGSTGQPGQPGRGVASATYDPVAGTLLLTYTDSTTAGPWPVKGEDGKSIEFTATVPTYADLPTDLTEADAGAGYYVEEDGELYPWSGTAFPAQGNGIEVRGPQGIQGEQGPRGTRWTVGVNPPSTGAAEGDLNLNPETGQVSIYAETAP